jgi:spermidine synthase
VTYLRSTVRQWDAIAIDIFRGAEIPAAILTSDIADLLAKVLEPGGLIVWNVADDALSWSAQWIAKALRQTRFAPILTSVLPGGVGNTLITCRQAGVDH